MGLLLGGWKLNIEDFKMLFEKISLFNRLLILFKKLLLLEL